MNVRSAKLGVHITRKCFSQSQSVTATTCQFITCFYSIHYLPSHALTHCLTASLLGGLVFGIPAAIIFVPYITFGKWDSFRKRILLIICIPLLLILFLAGFLTFYLIPDPSFCSFCHYINCVPYASGFCPEEFNNPNPTIFSL